MKSERASKLVALERLGKMGRKVQKGKNFGKGKGQCENDMGKKEKKVGRNEKELKGMEERKRIDGNRERPEEVNRNRELSEISEGMEKSVNIIHLNTPSSVQFYLDYKASLS